MNNDLQSIGPAVLNEVYQLAESLFLMQGERIPEGFTFSRSLSEEAARCWQAAKVVYLNSMESRIEG